MKNTKFVIVSMVVVGLLLVSAMVVQINKPQDNRSSAKEVETVVKRPQTTSSQLRCGEGIVSRSGRCVKTTSQTQDVSIDSDEVMLQQLTVDDSNVDADIKSLELDFNN